jgi:hypothetical protein
MKRLVISTIAFVGLFFAIALISNLPVRGNDNDQNGEDRESQSRIRIGFDIAPVPLNLRGKNRALVGLGSYIVNAQGGCNDCHTCPSYKPGHNPFPPTLGDGQINDVGYLAGGVDFGPFTSKNITPDPTTGRPAGLTLEQFKNVIRTGFDPVDGMTLSVMPWPIYRNMSDRDLEAVYSFLSAIPSATPPPPGMHCANAGQ